MKSFVLSYSVALTLIGLLCCIVQANENFSPRVLVLLKESDGFFDNSVDSDLNSVISPSDNYYSHSRHVQLWNKVFDNLQKRINVLGRFLWNVEKIPINSSPHVERRFKKSISIRKPRKADEIKNSSSLESSSPMSVLPITLTTNLIQSEIITTTVSTNTKSNMTDLQKSTNFTSDVNVTDSTTSVTSSPKLVETTPFIQQKIQNNTISDISGNEKTSSSKQQSCPYCSGIFLTVIVILAFGVTFFIYKKRQSRGSRTFYQVGNILCNKRDESPV